MRQDSLQFFYMVATEGSIRSASTRYGIPRTVLTRHIHSLEEKFRTPLFKRSARGLRLSEVGKILLVATERLLPHQGLVATQPERALAEIQLRPLTIGVSSAAAESRLTVAAMEHARRSVLETDSRLSMLPSDSQTDCLINGEIDVALLYRRGPTPSGVSYRDLQIRSFVLLVQKQHRLAKQSHIRLADLRDEEMIFPSLSSWPNAYHGMMSACLRGGLAPHIAMQVESESMAANLVAEGIAVCLADPFLIDRCQAPGISVIRVEDLDLQVRLAAMWPHDRVSPEILRFVDLLVACLAQTNEEPGLSVRRKKHVTSTKL